MHTGTLQGRFAWMASIGLALPALAGAADTAIDAHALGVAESALKFCEPLEPATSKKIRERIKQLAQGASEQQLAAARHSDEYQKAYASVVDFTGKVERKNAKRFCAQAGRAQR